jgi:hypothetical protein
VLTVPAHDAQRRACTLELHLDDVTPVAPDTRIDFAAQCWLYHDGTSPQHDRGTRERLAKLVHAIPKLAAEIARR